MTLALYLSRIPEALQLDAERQVPDAWLKLDVLSQGLVSRYLARERGAPKDSAATSSWVILRPFDPARPSLYAIWNSKKSLSKEDLVALAGLASHCSLDEKSFSPAELKLIESAWSRLGEWTP